MYHRLKNPPPPADTAPPCWAHLQAIRVSTEVPSSLPLATGHVTQVAHSASSLGVSPGAQHQCHSQQHYRPCAEQTHQPSHHLLWKQSAPGGILEPRNKSVSFYHQVNTMCQTYTKRTYTKMLETYHTHHTG